MSGKPMTADLHARLVTEVLDLKRGDALAPVTVVVPTTSAGRDVRGVLARAGAAASVRILTPRELVRVLSADALAPRVPTPFPVLTAAVEKALAEDPGGLAEVSAAATTADALADASRRLGGVPADTPVPTTALHSEVLRIHERALRATSATHHTAAEAFAVATSVAADVGPTVLFLPMPATRGDRGFLDALIAAGARVVDMETVPADLPSRMSIRGTLVIHASDADDEVRAVVRLVRARLESGIPGHRIGIAYPAADTYLRLLHTHLGDAGITVSGPDPGPLVDLPTARALLRLLEGDAWPSRADVASVLAMVGLTTGDDEIAPPRARAAARLTSEVFPVVGGDDWEHLRAAVSGLWERDADTARSLLAVVDGIHAAVAAIDSALTWDDVTDACLALLGMIRGRPEPEVATVASAVEGIRLLASVGGGPSRTRAAATVRANLAGVVPRHGEPGVGVELGPIAEFAGRDLDVLVVLGMAEGLLPTIRRPDPLVPEDSVGPTEREHLDLEFRRLQLALGSAPERVCTFPRGSMHGAEKVPSRWLTPTLETLAGGPVSTTGWAPATASAERVIAVESFAASVVGGDPRIGVVSATPTEWRLRELTADEAGRRSAVLTEVPGLRRAARMRADRRSGHFTEFTGNVGESPLLRSFFDRAIAPTRLEEWAKSPYLFFIRRILGVDVLSEPETIVEIDHLDRGNALHEVWESVVLSRLAGDAPDDAAILALGGEIFDAHAAASPGWLPALWARDRAELLEDLTGWIRTDREDASRGWSAIGAESVFGLEDGPEVSLDVVIDSGVLRVRFAGKVDRIDRGRDGTIRVTDYKTGKSAGYRALAEHPTGGGVLFQLAVYGLLARTIADGWPVVARYWFCTSRGGDVAIERAVDEEMVDALRADVGRIAGAITAGRFPPRSGAGSHRGLSDLLGGAELDRLADALSAHPDVFTVYPAPTAPEENR